jgi:hypothetical protein
MIDYTNRRFIIFDAQERYKIDYSQVYETSAETLRFSINGEKTFVEYNLPMPDSLMMLDTKSDPLTVDYIA